MAALLPGYKLRYTRAAELDAARRRGAGARARARGDEAGEPGGRDHRVRRRRARRGPARARPSSAASRRRTRRRRRSCRRPRPRGAATATSRRGRSRPAPSPPRVSSTTAGPSLEQRARGVDRRGVPGASQARSSSETLTTSAAREHAREPRRGRRRRRRYRRAAVRVDHHAARRPASRVDDRLQRGRHRLEHQPERADVQDRRRRAGSAASASSARQARRRRAPLVEAVARRAGVVDLGQRQRRRVVGAHDRVEAHAVGGEQRRQPLPKRSVEIRPR